MSRINFPVDKALIVKAIFDHYTGPRKPSEIAACVLAYETMDDRVMERREFARAFWIADSRKKLMEIIWKMAALG